ncbi:MAG: hypothetical protein JXB32_01710 [Deltaproteobacteria bacterium]|nr:hypothetical protein [Deltaproteobacteria bacterium]
MPRPRTVVAIVVALGAVVALWWSLAPGGSDAPAGGDMDGPETRLTQPTQRTNQRSPGRSSPGRPGRGAAGPAGRQQTSDASGEREPLAASASRTPVTGGTVAAATACDDGDPCTFDDRYDHGVCRGRPLHCDDDNPLTVDSCTGDGCLHAFVPSAFDPPAPAPSRQPGR